MNFLQLSYRDYLFEDAGFYVVDMHSRKTKEVIDSVQVANLEEELSLCSKIEMK